MNTQAFKATPDFAQVVFLKEKNHIHCSGLRSQLKLLGVRLGVKWT